MAPNKRRKTATAQHALDDSDENEFDYGPRAFAQGGEGVVERLPIKTQSGQLQRVMVPRKRRQAVIEDEDENAKAEGDEENGGENEEEPEIPERDQVRFAKEELAQLAEELIEDPEEHIGNLRKIQSHATHRLPKIRQLALVTELAVFKDIIPGYRIRPLTESEKAAKVTKEVKRVREFEQTLVLCYKAYVDNLARAAKDMYTPSLASSKYRVANTALACACALLSAVAHFNFRTELLTIITTRLARRRLNLREDIASDDDAGFGKCLHAICELFAQDDTALPSFDAVVALTQMLRRRKYKVDPAVLDCLLHLRLLTDLSELDARARQALIDEKSSRPKIKKKDRVHRTKKERKRAKEIKEIDEEFRTAAHEVSKEETARVQADILKLVFSTYLTVLKERASAGMTGAALEGLARFAHLVNADLFGDLLEVLKQLVRERQLRTTAALADTTDIEFVGTAATREALLCIVTAFALLAGQPGESIGLDLSFFVTYLYAVLLPLCLSPDVEQQALRLPDPLATTSTVTPPRANVNVATQMEMLIRALDALFFNKHYRTVTFGTGTNNHARVVAFAKRLALTSMHLPDRSAYAVLGVLDALCVRYGGGGHVASSAGEATTARRGPIAALFATEDRIMNGVYRAETDEPEQSNAGAACVYETFLLEKHYSPRVAASAKDLPRRSVQGAVGGGRR
ncbi:nucleolar complex-associated protein-domain-containing protein [Limtongia smithiae]|uniref:nucleolar complex-associated protein-domain-containing protein n=1 Tax=Limtongia smithiae TaxID=1125753 RepID=UPI0034CD6E60